MTSRDWKKSLVTAETSILEAIRIIDAGAIQIGFVVDAQDKLLGTVTDGDIRRNILKGTDLNCPVTEIMNRTPSVAYKKEKRAKILETMKAKDLRWIPVLDGAGRIDHVEFLDELLGEGYQDSWVVLMAGGLGTRLSPLTNDCPKPLLKVGDSPLLETTIKHFAKSGFRRFYIAVNYRAEMIKDYFGDGSKLGVRIDYLHETQRLGTAGALSLLPEKPESPLIVMNGDILTNASFEQMLEFHEQHKAAGTMGVRQYEFQVPYGVVSVEDSLITGMSEKPVQRFFVNAGIYVLSPEVLAWVKPSEPLDMPSLFHIMKDRGMTTAAFPIREYWADIGGHEELLRAKMEYSGIFQ